MRAHRFAGFTILELSVVLVIVAVITGMGMVATLGALESAKRVSTNNKLDAIEKALMAYRLANDTLPCPAPLAITASSASYGVAALSPGECNTSGTIATMATNATTDSSAFQGAVPVKTLNLPVDFMYDGWGRHILYTVMTIYTEPQIFRYMHPRETCGSKVLASSDTSFIRSSNTVYTLTSFGPNGHGGVTAAGTTVNAGSSNYAEMYNCRCNTTGHIYSTPSSASTLYSVQQNYAQNPSDSNDVFDDMVRYKERWQMQSPDDYTNFTTFTKAQLIIGFDFSAGTATGQFLTYQKQCKTYVDNSSAISGSVDAANIYRYIGTSNDNSTAVAISSVYGCQLYSISGTTFTAITNAPTNFAPNANNSYAYSCPAAASINGATVNDDYLAVLSNTAGTTTIPWIRMWRIKNKALGPMNISMPAASLPAAAPNVVAVSKGAEYVILSRTSASAYTTVFKRSGNVLTAMASQPSGMPAGATAIEFSKDSNLLVANDHGTIKVWKRTSDEAAPYAALDDIITGFTDINAMAFSPDGQYLAVTATIASTEPDINNLIEIYKITGTVFSKVTITGNYSAAYESPVPGILSMKFTPDSAFLIGIDGEPDGTAYQKVVVLNKQGVDSFRLNTAGGVSSLPSKSPPTTLVVYH